MVDETIKGVELLSVSGTQGLPSLLLRVTDGDGTWGVGEVGPGLPDEYTEPVEELAAQALGQDPIDRERTWQTMASVARDWEGPPEPMAMIDCAAW